MIVRAIVVLFCLVLSACHFQLRGTDTLPKTLSPIAIQCHHVSPEWKPQLRSRLEIAGLRVVDDPSAARYLLIIDRDELQRNIMSVSSGSSSRQYQLGYKVFFSFEKMKGETYFSETPVLVTRPLTINNDRILGSHDEEDKIIHDIRHDAITQIMYRLRSQSARFSPIQQRGIS